MVEIEKKRNVGRQSIKRRKSNETPQKGKVPAVGNHSNWHPHCLADVNLTHAPKITTNIHFYKCNGLRDDLQTQGYTYHWKKTSVSKLDRKIQCSCKLRPY